MKIRTGYVSNSSSSSFIIAYDENLFGDLTGCLESGYVGCETSVAKTSDLEEFYKYLFLNDEEKEIIKNKIKRSEADGKKVIHIELDRDYEIIFDLFKQISKNTDKIEFIYGGGDY